MLLRRVLWGTISWRRSLRWILRWILWRILRWVLWRTISWWWSISCWCSISIVNDSDGVMLNNAWMMLDNLDCFILVSIILYICAHNTQYYQDNQQAAYTTTSSSNYNSTATMVTIVGITIVIITIAI